MSYPILRSAFQYMDDATFRSGPSVAPAYGTSRAKDPRIPRSAYAAASRADYGRASHGSYGMPYDAIPAYESDRYAHGHNPRHLRGDSIQITNQEASLSNSSHRRLLPHALIHPMMCRDGGFPTGFSMSRPMEDMLAMSDHQIEQILAEYGVSSGSARYANDMYGRGSSKARKLMSLATLLDFLGARQLAELVRQKGSHQTMDPRRSDRMMLQY